VSENIFLKENQLRISSVTTQKLMAYLNHFFPFWFIPNKYLKKKKKNKQNQLGMCFHSLLEVEINLSKEEIGSWDKHFQMF